MQSVKFINGLKGNLGFKLPGCVFETVTGFTVAVKLCGCDVF